MLAKAAFFTSWIPLFSMTFAASSYGLVFCRNSRLFCFARISSSCSRIDFLDPSPLAEEEDANDDMEAALVSFEESVALTLDGDPRMELHNKGFS